MMKLIDGWFCKLKFFRLALLAGLIPLAASANLGRPEVDRKIADFFKRHLLD